MSVPSAARECPTCGRGLPGPVDRCPRCGADLRAALDVEMRRSNASTRTAMWIALIPVVLVATAIWAASAFPSFMRDRLRAKQSQVGTELDSLVRAEQSAAGRTGAYVPIAGVPAGEPHGTKTSLSAEERAAAASMGWQVEDATYGRYRVAVSSDGSAASLCGESDLDEDGRHAVFVAFLPGSGGGADAVPPPAPCITPVDWLGEYAPGAVYRVTELDVF